MFLGFLSIVIMLIVAYAFWREGALTGFTMLCNVFLAGLVAFNFFEPIAAELDPMFAGSFAHGYEDSLCLVALFCLTLGLLRLITNSLSNLEIEYPAALRQGGAVLCGLLTGYLVAGFLLCVLQTLPWSENFMNFQAKVDPKSPHHLIRNVLPPDRVWLALMHRASVGPFSHSDSPAFDPHGSFEARYGQRRRQWDQQ